jgi:2-hydroxychromene-2-carboxylate isomerase
MPLRIAYYFSLNSPWTYLGADRFTALLARYGAEVGVHPVDFGTIFAATGGLPLARRHPARQAYRLQELRRWRDALGLPLLLSPRHFPAPETLSAPLVLAVRETEGAEAALALAHRILTALWAEDRDPANPATLAALCRELKLPASLLEKAADPLFSALRARETEEAIARGVFGAPSYVLGEEIFWGQDRLDFLAAALERAAAQSQ